MSHFAVGVVLPKNQLKSIEGYVSIIMMPFSETLIVDDYISFTKDELIEGFFRYKNDIETELSGTLKELIDVTVETFTIPKLNIWSNYYHGKNVDDDGNLHSTYNPDSKWDYWEIGGRWNNFFKDCCKYNGPDKNVIPVREYLNFIKNNFESASLFALIDSNGKWHEKGNMGWWGVVHDEIDNDTWKIEFISTLEKEDSDAYVVCVDCHI